MRIIIVDVILRNTFVTTPPLRHGFARAHRHAVPARPPRVAAGRGRAADAAAGLVGAARRGAATGLRPTAGRRTLTGCSKPCRCRPRRWTNARTMPPRHRSRRWMARAPRPAPHWLPACRPGRAHSAVALRRPALAAARSRTAVEPRPRAARTARQLRRPAAVAVRLIAFLPAGHRPGPAEEAFHVSTRCLRFALALPDPRHDPSP